MAATMVLTLAEWNSIITGVNALAVNPPPGCKAQGTIPQLTAPHRWSQADITAVQGVLKAICPSNTFPTPAPTEWKQSTIDAIGQAISKGWCNCQPPQCKCKNAGPSTSMFVGGWTVAGCTSNTDMPDCNPNTGTLNKACLLGGNAYRAYNNWAIQAITACTLAKMLPPMNAQLANLQAAMTAACAGQEAPLPPCRAAMAAVQQQQAAIQLLQNNISTLNQKAGVYKDQGDSYRDQAMAALKAVVGQPGMQNTALLIPGNGAPWPDLDTKTCCNPSNCISRWSLQYRVATSTGMSVFGGFPTPWREILSGFFSPDGTPYIISAGMCPLFDTHTCWSTDCSVGMTLPICQGVSTVQVQYVIYYPIS
jgi:hypothetical protein